MFTEYPFREYPEPIYYDPKTKKPIDPVTKKVLRIYWFNLYIWTAIRPCQAGFIDAKEKEEEGAKIYYPGMGKWYENPWG